MTKGLSDNAVKWLTYLVYFMMFLLTLIAGWSKYESSANSIKIAEMERCLPDKYVRLERYTKDQENDKSNLNDIKDMIRDLKRSIDKAIDREFERTK